MSAETIGRPIQAERVPSSAEIQVRFDDLFSFAGKCDLADIRREVLEFEPTDPIRRERRPAVVTEWFPSGEVNESGEPLLFRLALVKNRVLRTRDFALIEQKTVNSGKSSGLARIYPDGFIASPFPSYGHEHSDSYREIVDGKVLQKLSRVLDSFEEHIRVKV